MSRSTILRREIRKSEIALADIARRAGVPLTTLHTFVHKEGSEMRASNFEKVAGAFAALGGATVKTARASRAVREEPAPFEPGGQIAVTIDIRTEELETLRHFGIDIEAVARHGATQALKEAQARAWREANREAIEASIAWIEKHGTLAEQLGLI